MKRCPKCAIAKPVEEFYDRKSSPSGKASWCKACFLALHKAKGESAVAGGICRDHGIPVRPGCKRRCAKCLDSERRHCLRKFGLSIQEYEALLAAQDGRCAVCRRTPDQAGRKPKLLAVDHDHVTGQVRGLLCTNCNTAIGKAADDPVRLCRMADYILASRRSSLRVA